MTMPAERIDAVCATLRKIINPAGIHELARDERFRGDLDGAEAESISHLLYMLDEIPKFVAEDRREKAMRWIGFVQGVVCVWYGVPVEELKEMNRPRE